MIKTPHLSLQAFTWFALAEYLIAIANLMFHLSSAWDFGDHTLAVLGPPVLAHAPNGAAASKKLK